ncbi:hypothetical protein EXT48_03430 [Pseudoalteromonas sp. CO348]|uniref:hypothetical protein n=1 Tax=Pseudoalteromonas TaxID=53246 RepID=UPI0005FA354C|nr:MULTISPECIES: hypothetical protein [Pseudoalteromonas]KJY90146.1 hypothetical protein TW73_21495 [Pseudoalteromonas piscicida]RZG08685.1 hypothetical protein EXT48_03430 [Pseudoalteromonas sp. CO348]
MTEAEIKKSIDKHSVKPLIFVVIMMLLIALLNNYLLEDDPLTPNLLIFGALAACIHIFKNVLCDVLVTKSAQNGSK